MKKIILSAVIGFHMIIAQAQETQKSLQFSAYVDVYYSYDFAKPNNHTRPEFLYNYNRSNEVNLNLGLAKVSYTTENVRANLALMTGTYAQYNLANEADLLKNVYEANVGIKISPSHNLWLDFGIMPAHIGFESAIGKDCPTLTRSILAENSPYYESGIKIGYVSKSEKWYIAAMYLNGWQRIQKVDSNQTAAFGTQISYKPSEKTNLNWSTYIGNEYPEEIKKWRYFNNFYGQFKLSTRTNITAGFDIGFEQQYKNSNRYFTWFTPIVILQQQLTPKIQIAARGEYYSDKNGVIITTETANGFQTKGFSLNFDYHVAANVMFRLEARNLSSTDNLFMKNNHPTDNTTFVTTSLAISL